MLQGLVRLERIALFGMGLVMLSATAYAEPPPAAHAHHHHEALPAVQPVDGESLFQLKGVFKDEEGRKVRLSSFAGQPTLIVMFYGTCKTVCPLLIEEARSIDRALTDAERKRLRVVLVTFDPERDTAERLQALASERALERPRWTLLRGTDRDLRELAMVLGVQYRKLDNGDFAHSAVLTLLDAQGRVAARIEGLRQPNAGLVSKLRTLLSAAPAR